MIGVEDGSLRERIEILESLVKRALAAAAAGSIIGFTGPVVANEAAAAAFPMSDVPGGIMQVFVLSHRSIWTKRNGVAGVQGVPPLAAHEVIAATAGPAGVLTRTEYSDPTLRIGINDIWIDPANGAANDENDGLTAATPLKTGYELFRRWGWNASKPIVGPNLATSPLGFVNIHVQTDLVSPDSLPIKVTAAANSSGPRVVGGPSTILRTATLTDAVTAMNPAVPAPGGTRLTVRDNTLLSWAAFMVANRRVRMIDGPAAGGTFQPQTDSLATAGQVQCSACQTTNASGFSRVATTVTPAVGNTYVVESLVIVNIGAVDISQELNPAFGGFEAFLNIENCNLPSTGSQNWVPRSDAGVNGPSINLYQCTIDRGVDVGLANITFIACYFSKQEISCVIGHSDGPAIEGGGANGFIAGPVSGLLIAMESATADALIDGDFVANGASIFSVVGAMRNFASWNAQAVAGINAGGHGVIVGGGGTGTFFAYRGVATFKGLLWGNTTGGFQAGAGLLVSAGCIGVGAPQNITGGQGDGKLANNPSAGGAAFNTYWDQATGTYRGAAGGFAASDFTWVLLAAAKAGPGYGFSVHFPDQDAHFVASETSA
jgi:F0F1-type ATP synthase membrane subunit c/vacuolar-type H+-ATPase subunit K